MFELPLFPLNSVLFPGALLHLHIFEHRYLQMISDCQKNQTSFGVALIRKGHEAHGPLAEPYFIGCMCQIMEIQPLEAEKMKLIAVGGDRFRLLRLDRYSKPYLIGQAQLYPLDNPDPVDANQKVFRLRRQFDRFIERLQQISPNQLNLDDLPKDEVLFAYFAAAVLQLSSQQKQELLTISNLSRLILRLERHYSREIALLDVVLRKEESLQVGGFSRN